MRARCWRGADRDGGDKCGHAPTSAQSIWMNAPQVAFLPQSVSRPSPRATPRSGITLSRLGDDANDPNSTLIFDRRAVPTALADGLPSALPLRAVRPPKRAAFRLMTFSRTSSTFGTLPTRAFSSSPHAHQPAQRLSVGQLRLFWAAVRRYSLPSRPRPLR